MNDNLAKVYNILKKYGILTLLFKITSVIYRISLFKLNTKKNKVYNKIQYDAPVHPYKNLVVPSVEIERHLAGGELKSKPIHHIGLGNVRTGNWDNPSNTRQVRSGAVARRQKAYEHVFSQGGNWEETDFYNHILNKIGEKDNYNETEKPREFLNELLKNTEKLYNSMKEKGYVAGHDGGRVVPDSGQVISEDLEILIAIDRNGKILFFDGRHRLGIAQILDIDVAVQVVCRHKKWQEFRDEIYKNGLSDEHEKLRDHPDLQDILD